MAANISDRTDRPALARRTAHVVAAERRAMPAEQLERLGHVPAAIAEFEDVDEVARQQGEEFLQPLQIDPELGGN